MKIRVKLLEHSEEWEEVERRLIEKYPEARKILKKIGNDLKETYIELETGGQFDELSGEYREALKEFIAEALNIFGKLLIGGISFDVAADLQGVKECFGINAIIIGLKEMEEQMEIAAMMAKPSKDNQVDH